MHSLSQKDYFQIFEKESLEEVELTRRKNTDYACDANAFKNFNVIEYLTDGAVTTEEGILTRLADKFTRVTHLLTRAEGSHKVKEESVLDTLRDISVYSKILRIYLMTRPREVNMARDSEKQVVLDPWSKSIDPKLSHTIKKNLDHDLS